jgi:hypothetical protein
LPKGRTKENQLPAQTEIARVRPKIKYWTMMTRMCSISVVPKYLRALNNVPCLNLPPLPRYSKVEQVSENLINKKHP